MQGFDSHALPQLNIIKSNSYIELVYIISVTRPSPKPLSNSFSSVIFSDVSSSKCPSFLGYQWPVKIVSERLY